MSGASALAELARLLGIETRHTDALGVVHDIAEDALLALVAAFGLPPDPTRAIESLNERSRSVPFGLAPVHLLHAEDEQPRLGLRLNAGAAPVEWECLLETGERRSGTAFAASVSQDPERCDLALPSGLPLGYHRLALRAGTLEAQLSLIVAPPSCYLPPELRPGGRCWGLTAQLYGLRSGRDWGMGDFGDLARLASGAGEFGAAVLGLNPLHALFAAEPRHVSPYSPSSRSHLDYLYIDVTAVPGYPEAAQEVGVSEELLGAARAAPLVDHAAVAALKRPVLEAAFRHFQRQELARGGTPLGQAFRRFQREGGEALAAFAAFEALQERFAAEGNLSWRSWPAAMRNPSSPEIAQFARVHRDRIEFFQFLQWQAEEQLAAAAAAARAGGLSIGLYRDLAVGVDPNGAEAWGDQALVAPGASIGAPPDPLSRAGQNWGLAPVNPVVLRERAFAPLVNSLRANMRHAGVLRIDHVMSLKRLYWIPTGTGATGGAYVNYPFEDLLRLVALESRRHSCAVIGEDLGTVPEGFREAMQAANVLSYRVVAFERRSDRTLVPPQHYPPLAAASAATHDIATLKGFWLGRDIDWRTQLDLYPDAAARDTEVAERSRDRQMLLQALAAEGLMPAERFPEFLSAAGEPVYSAKLGDAILAYLARSHSRLMLIQLEDVIGESEQANLPGTIDQHPNWRRRMSRSIEDILAGPELKRVAALVAQERASAGPAS